MTTAARDLFHGVGDTNTHSGLELAGANSLLAAAGLILPPQHVEFLQWSNGLEAYAGYFRLFGIGPSAGVDAIRWNQDDCWKFAWCDRCADYWCFGETAWGDQYAYAVDSIRSDTAPKVYFLDAVSMTPEVISTSFAEFLEAEFLRSAREPYDAIIPLARQKFGPLEVGYHLTYVPSLLLGGTETVNNVTKMNARAAMIANGDLAIQLDAGPADAQVKGVQPYEDTEGRMRLRLVWAEKGTL